MSLADTDDLHAGDLEPRVHATYEWERVDGARVMLRITRIRDGVAWMRCYDPASKHTWTRRHKLPLFPTMRRRKWTTAELLDAIE